MGIVRRIQNALRRRKGWHYWTTAERLQVVMMERANSFAVRSVL